MRALDRRPDRQGLSSEVNREMKNDPTERQYMISENYDKAITAYKALKERGGRDPVVLILDLRDKMARKVMGVVRDDEYIREALHDHALKNEIATAILAVERRVAGEVLSRFSPSARTAMGSGLPLLACVSAGGTAYAVMEVGR